MLLETVQQFQAEITNFRDDNERWRLEQERIMKSLSDRQNQRNPYPNPENGNRDEMQQKWGDHPKSEGGRMDNEEEFGNTSDRGGTKRPKIELQGEFKKIKPHYLIGKQRKLLKPS